MGVGFGLFAVLSIVRLRSEPFSNRELAYFFVALVLALVSAIDLGSLALTRRAGRASRCSARVGDRPPALAARRAGSVTLEQVFPTRRRCARHLEERLGAPVLDVRVLEIDYVRETTHVEVRSRRPATRRPPDAAVAARSLSPSRRSGSTSSTRRPAGPRRRQVRVPAATFAALAERLRATHRVLEIDGRRASATARPTSTRPTCCASATTCRGGGGATSAARASTSTAALRASRSSSRARAGARSSTGCPTTRRAAREPRWRSCASLSASTVALPSRRCGPRWTSLHARDARRAPASG